MTSQWQQVLPVPVDVRVTISINRLLEQGGEEDGRVTRWIKGEGIESKNYS